MKQATIDRCVERSKGMADGLLETLVRVAIKDFEEAEAREFSVTIRVKGERHGGRDGDFVLSANGKSGVRLDTTEEAEAEIIEYGGGTMELPGMGEDEK